MAQSLRIVAQRCEISLVKLSDVRPLQGVLLHLHLFPDLLELSVQGNLRGIKIVLCTFESGQIGNSSANTRCKQGEYSAAYYCELGAIGRFDTPPQT